jgi:hypothetical protein
MNLEQLVATGGLVQNGPVEKQISWAGEPRRVFVKTLSYADHERILRLCGVFGGDDGESSGRDASSNAAVIAVAIRLGDDAKERLTYDQACALHPDLARELLRVVDEVNHLASGKKP